MGEKAADCANIAEIMLKRRKIQARRAERRKRE